MAAPIAAAATGAALGAVASLVLKPWADQAASLAQKQIAKMWGVDEALGRLSHKLRLNESVLEDAEQKQFTDKHVGAWLERFKDAGYDAEDVLDEVATREAIRRTEEEEGGHMKPVRIFSRFSSIPYAHGMASRIREIDQRLEYLAKESEHLCLRSTGSKLGKIEISLDRQTTSAPEENLLGREDEKEAIIRELLTSDDQPETSSNPRAGARRKVTLIPIIGMGGIGKTTLAQMVFNDERVKNYFPFRKWICVSENFDASTLIAQIIGVGQGQSTMEEQHLSLRRTLRRAKFLIVLDDVWCEEQRKVQQLWVPLCQVDVGGKVIVTTRSKQVANAFYPVDTNFLSPLSEEFCWLLFETRAFVNGHSDNYPSLKECGRRIVKKLKGVPLAAKLVGGFLRNIPDEGLWRSLLESDIWKLVDEKNNILPILYLSYLYLPANLKRCFAYCAIFPKDYAFDTSMLVSLWMAQGFIAHQGTMRTEDVGRIYFNDLLQRSFFQHVQDSYVMHDLIHDLAESVSGDECLRIGVGEAPKSSITPEKIRHLTFGVTDWKFIGQCKKSRTFLRLYDSFGLKKWVSDHSIRAIKCVRVLILDKIVVETLPDSIGELIHLRYLHVVYVKRLPESLCQLFNLQTLIVHRETEMLKSMSRLVNLRHLSTGDENIASIGMPAYLQGLNSLTGRKMKGPMIGEPQNLRHLSGEVVVANLVNMERREEVIPANSKDKVCCTLM